MKPTFLTTILALLLIATSIGQASGQSKPADAKPIKPTTSKPATTPGPTTPPAQAPVTTPGTPASPSTEAVQTPKAPATPRVKLITNVFTDADAKTIIQEIASATGQAIIADTSVKVSDVSIEFKKDTIESALDKLSYAIGTLWKKKGDLYLLSTGQPDAPLFDEFAETKIYSPHTQAAENLFGLLTRSFTAYAQLDKAANVISVTAPPKQMQAIWKALTAADSPKKQFCVEAMVTEMNSQDIKTAGFSWNWQYFAQGADLALTYATATTSDIVNLKSLITNNKAELRANPKIVASEGHEASLTVGTETYFSMVSGNSNYSTVQYQKVNTGITLKFTGYIEEDGMVNLHIQPEVSDAVVLVNGNPQTTVRKADTYMRIHFGDTVALGGMIVSSTNKQHNKTPILGDLPIIGNAFRSTTTEKDKREVVILITPRMLQDAIQSAVPESVSIKS
ncbi:MAG: type II and III secretion system protein [Fimbriimonas sp.]|nr:type II and III secretion system protein [Fimbriimonas sp.]